MSNLTRVNLHITVLDSGRLAYDVLHIGFFPKGAVKAIVANLDIQGLAFNSGFPRQTGVAAITTSETWNKPGQETGYVIERRVAYEPRVRSVSLTDSVWIMPAGEG